MLTEDQFIEYFERVAIAHKLIAHDPDGVRSFFEVEDPDELTSFDEALRNTSATTVMLVVAGEGELDDNESESHLQTLEFQIYILQKNEIGAEPRDVRTVCGKILSDFLARVKRDRRNGSLVPGSVVHFRISKVPVRKVGPMALQWYGYTALLSFSCPFGPKIETGTWTDIP